MTALLRRLPARAVPPLVLAAVAAFLFRDILFGGRVLYYRDIHLQWVVQAEAFVQSLAAGSWPVWNRLVTFGQPLAANPNNEVFYPFTWLHVGLLPWNYYTLFAVAHVSIAAAGIYRFARRLDLSRIAATAAGATWMASGPLLSMANLWNHLAGAAWIGWSGWAADRAVATGRPGAALTWGAAVALPVLAGSPETSLMAAAVAGLALLRRRREGARRIAGATAIAAAFAVAISAAQWIPSLELARRSMRRQLTQEQTTMWSVPAPLLTQVVIPALLDPLPLQPHVRNRLFEGREPFLASLYLGLAAAALVAAALAGGAAFPRVLLALWGACLLVALGRHGAPYAWLVDLVPGVQSLRFPSKTMILAGILWSVSVGFGVDAACRSAAARSALRVVAVVLASMVGALGVILWLGADVFGPLLVAPEFTRRPLADVLAPVWGNLLTASAAGYAMAALAAAREARLSQRGRMVALTAVAVLDLALAHRNLNHTAEPELMRFRPPALAHLAGAPVFSRVYSYDYIQSGGHAPRYLGHEGYVLKLARDLWPVPWADAAALRTVLYPSVLGYWGVEGAYSIDQLGLYAPDLAALTWFLRAREETPVELRLLQMGAVSRVLTLHRQGLEDLRVIAEVPTLFIEDLKVLEVPNPLPRAYAVDGVRVADRLEALKVIDDPGFDPRRELILAAGVPGAPDPAFAGKVRVEALRPDRTVLAAELSGPGYVVLVDTFDPGWRATVDGVPAPVVRANLAFQAVAVPAGAHRIELVYRPRSLLVGLAVTGAALATALVVGRRRAAPAQK
jgi:hypothetical protein